MIQPLSLGAALKERYRIEQVIGCGGTGWVYRCRDEASGRQAAVKEAALPSCCRVCRSVCPSGDANGAQWFDSLKKRMKAEAALFRKHLDFPELLRIFDCFEENNTVYIVMELIEGETLRAYIRRGVSLLEEDVRVFGVLLLRAVKRLHGEGLLHLDISPENIMIAESVKLIDFGAVGRAKEKRRESIWVREGYSPPEQYSRQAVLDFQTDLYAVGAVLYETLTGVRPPPGRSRADGRTLAEPKELRRDISDDLNRVLIKAMAICPEDRYQSAEEMERALLIGNDAREQIKRVLLAEGAASLVLALAAVLTGL